MHTDSLLITGATGLVGAELLTRLRARDADRPIIALVRQPNRLPPVPDVYAIQGDLRLPNLGLAEEKYKDLQEHVTAIIHAAANVNFSTSLEESRAVNTGGTGRLLRFANGCPSLDRFAHISTVFVAGQMEGEIGEEPLHHECGFLNPYHQSKYEAEQLVLDAMSRIPSAIYRLSTIIGDSTTGEVRQFNSFHWLFRTLFSHSYPLAVIPANPEAPMDFIASDWASEALSILIRDHFQPGEVYHVCTGAEESIRAVALLNLAFTYVVSGEQSDERRKSLPQIVSLEEFKQYVTTHYTSSNHLIRKFLRLSDLFLPHLTLHQSFQQKRTTTILDASGCSRPQTRDYLPKVLAYCAKLWASKGQRHS